MTKINIKWNPEINMQLMVLAKNMHDSNASFLSPHLPSCMDTYTHTLQPVSTAVCTISRYTFIII